VSVEVADVNFGHLCSKSWTVDDTLLGDHQAQAGFSGCNFF
jgi:hypothetical protein